MMPAYNNNRLSSLYFHVYMMVTFFFLTNFMLASVVNSYENELERRKEEQLEVNNTKLLQAYNILSDGSNTISRDVVMDLFYIINEDFPEVPTIPPDKASILFAVLDADGTGDIDQDEFLEFGTVLLLEFQKVQSIPKTFMELYFPKIHSSRSYQNFSTFIESGSFDNVIDTILIGNAIVIFIQSYDMLMGTKPADDTTTMDEGANTLWEVLETVFTSIYTLEMIMKILVSGWYSYSKAKRNIFDMAITLLAIVATAYVYYPNDYSDERLIRFVVMARVLRISRLLIRVDQFRTIAIISIDVVSRAKMIFLLLFIIIYIWAALGVQIFGGLITRDPDDPNSYLLSGSDFAESNYWANNFNDMFGAINVIFDLLIVNNWTIIQNGYESVLQSRYNRLYFLSFYIFGNVLVNNIVVAFIIEAFIRQWDSMKKSKRISLSTDDYNNNDEDNDREHNNGVKFNAKRITGTDTNVSGNFSATFNTDYGSAYLHRSDNDKLNDMFN